MMIVPGTMIIPIIRRDTPNSQSRSKAIPITPITTMTVRRMASKPIHPKTSRIVYLIGRVPVLPSFYLGFKLH